MSSKRSKALEELDVLDAQRILAVARLRVLLLRHAGELLPEAVSQARAGRTALLRLLARLSTQRTLRDRDRKP